MKKSTTTHELIRAKEFEVNQWIDENGVVTSPIKLADFKGKFKIIFSFQSWCPGCHSNGFPSLQKMINGLKGNKKIQFLAIQTVFEGFHKNTFEKIKEAQKQYDLRIPFGHDAGNNESGSNFMKNYQTGGTPWFVLIDENDQIVFSDFHINAPAAIEILNKI